jgi:hypothetical protein
MQGSEAFALSWNSRVCGFLSSLLCRTEETAVVETAFGSRPTWSGDWRPLCQERGSALHREGRDLHLPAGIINHQFIRMISYLYSRSISTEFSASSGCCTEASINGNLSTASRNSNSNSNHMKDARGRLQGTLLACSCSFAAHPLILG